jgi:hypothetical protein
MRRWAQLERHISAPGVAAPRCRPTPREEVEARTFVRAGVARCDEDLGLCEQRVVSMAALPDFRDGPGGHHQ